eukprot:31275_1
MQASVIADQNSGVMLCLMLAQQIGKKQNGDGLIKLNINIGTQNRKLILSINFIFGMLFIWFIFLWSLTMDSYAGNTTQTQRNRQNGHRQNIRDAAIHKVKYIDISISIHVKVILQI